MAEAKKGPQFQELLVWIFDQVFEEFRKLAKEVYTDLDFSQFKYIDLEETTTGNVAAEDEEEGGDEVESARSGMIVESQGESILQKKTMEIPMKMYEFGAKYMNFFFYGTRVFELLCWKKLLLL